MLTFPKIGNQGAIPSLSDVLNAFSNANAQSNALVSTGAADTLSANIIAGGLFSRSGGTVAVAATTDTAANIIAAIGPNAGVGQTFLFFYNNLNTAAGAVTVSGGTGVTMGGMTLIPVSNTLLFLGVISAVGSSPAVVLNGVATLGGVILPASQFTTISSGNGTLAAGAIEGAVFSALATSGATALTTRTAAQMITQAGLSVGQSYVIRVYNTNAGTLTLTGGTGVTITGTATIATNVWRDYVVTVTGASAITLQNVGSGTAN